MGHPDGRYFMDEGLEAYLSRLCYTSSAPSQTVTNAELNRVFFPRSHHSSAAQVRSPGCLFAGR